MKVFKGLPGGARRAYIAEEVRQGARATPMVSFAYSSVHGSGKDAERMGAALSKALGPKATGRIKCLQQRAVGREQGSATLLPWRTREGERGR